MGRSAWRLVQLTAGAVLLILAVGGFVVLPEHRPVYAVYIKGSLNSLNGCPGKPFTHTELCRGWTRTQYDAIHVACWALLILGAILVAVGLIRTWQHEPVTAG